MYAIKARTHGCMRNDSETHSTGVTGLHSRLRRSCNPVIQSRAFHCHFAHTRAFSLYALTLACYASCDRAPPEMHPLKMFEILGHPHFKQLHGHKIPMNATNSPDRLNLHIFSLNLSYHSFVSVHDIQQKRLLNKISVYAFTHPGVHQRVANATLQFRRVHV